MLPSPSLASIGSISRCAGSSSESCCFSTARSTAVPVSIFVTEPHTKRASATPSDDAANEASPVCTPTAIVQLYCAALAAAIVARRVWSGASMATELPTRKLSRRDTGNREGRACSLQSMRRP